MNVNEIKAEYEQNNPLSKKAWETSRQSIPGGVSGNVRFYSPFPLFMKKGKGAWLRDLDNHDYVDYVLSYGPLILGHGREEIIHLFNQYITEHGTFLYGTPHEDEIGFAEMLKKYYPSLEAVRYTNSGTEATLLAIRTARAYTGKRKVGKFEGHYHGGFDEVLISVKSPIEQAGNISRPNSIPESAGISEQTLEETIVLPFNDLDSCIKILEENKNEIACIIMEPFLGGTICATDEFMKGIRKVTSELGILFIMDEVKTGFRVGIGGAQEYYNVKPDLTTLGKIIGAGFPIGVLGGRREILENMAPTGSEKQKIGEQKRTGTDVIYHSGTYNGHPLILALGMETIRILENEMEDLVANTEYLKREIQESYKKHGVKVLTPGVGAAFNICVTEQDEILTYRELKKCDFDLRRRMDYALMLEGVYCKPCTRYYTSTAHTMKEIDYTLDKYEKAWKKI